MIVRFVLFVLASCLPLGAGIASTSQDRDATLSDERRASDAVEVAERQKILVMIEQAPNRLRPGSSYSSGYGSAQTKAARERLGRTIAKEYGFEFVELWPMPLIGLDCFIMKFTEQYSATEAAEMVEQHPSVEWAEPMDVYETLATASSDDPLTTLSPAAEAWNLKRVHSSWTGRNVTVAVIDTQVDTEHPDLKGRVKVSRNFAPQSPMRPEYHGTEVAGIIAANARNGIGIAGVAPGARLMALRACWQRAGSRSSACTSLNLARAMNYAIERGAKVINLSLGGPPNRLLTRLINTASARGIAVVAAYDPERPKGGFPASHPGVIAVSQMGVSTAKGYVAPGMDIPTTRPGGGFHFVSGSSYSAAHVSGLLALRYERGRGREAQWRSLVRTASNSREIDISATFE